MSDKIRIAYNWIGPRGPIPNTEVPNILNLASVAQKSTCMHVRQTKERKEPNFTNT